MGFGANWVIQKAKNSHDIPIIKQVPDFAFHDQDGPERIRYSTRPTPDTKH